MVQSAGCDAAVHARLSSRSLHAHKIAPTRQLSGSVQAIQVSTLIPAEECRNKRIKAASNRHLMLPMQISLHRLANAYGPPLDSPRLPY